MHLANSDRAAKYKEDTPHCLLFEGRANRIKWADVIEHFISDVYNQILTAMSQILQTGPAFQLIVNYVFLDQ